MYSNIVTVSTYINRDAFVDLELGQALYTSHHSKSTLGHVGSRTFFSPGLRLIVGGCRRKVVPLWSCWKAKEISAGSIELFRIVSISVFSGFTLTPSRCLQGSRVAWGGGVTTTFTHHCSRQCQC